MTAGSLDEARQIASALVAERLAACANLLPGMESVYRWQGKVESETEIVIIAKTRESLFEQLRARIVELHSYDCPCIVALPITDGHPEFLSWIRQNTR